MMTSGEVAAAFAAQNQMFGQQRQFAGQISPGFGAGPAQFAGMHGPASYSYGPSGMGGNGMGVGNRFAGGAMSGLGAAAGVASTGLGVAGMFGKLGMMNNLIDPFSAGMAGFRAGGLMGAAAGAAVPLALGAVAAHGISSFIGGGQQQAGVTNTLNSNFQHFNPGGSRTGFGFGRQEAQAIGDQVRGMAHIPEMMTSMAELTSMLPRLKQAGAMQGASDVAEFGRRFKEAVGTIRDMSKILGTSMEEATTFFQHSRSVGFLGKTDQLKNALNVQLTAGLTGMSTGQVMGLQSAGADMATQAGGRRSIGARAVTSIAQGIGGAQMSGALSQGLLEDITGLQGAEAVQAGAGRMAGLMSGMARGTAAGRLMMAGMVKFDENGRAVGLDEDLVKQFQSGSLGVDDLKRRAQGLTRQQKVSFTARQADLSMDFAGQVGPGGMAKLVDNLVGGRHGDEGSNLLMQRFGASAADADLMMEMRDAGQQNPFGTMSQMRAREAEIKDRTDPKAIMQRIKTRMHNATAAPLEKLGSSVYTALGKAFDSFVDDLVGRHMVTLSEGGARAFEQAMSGGSQDDLKRIFSSGADLKFNSAGFARANAGRASIGKTLGFMMGGQLGSAVGGMMMDGPGGFGSHIGAFMRRGELDSGYNNDERLLNAMKLTGNSAEGLMGAMAGFDSGAPFKGLNVSDGAKALLASSRRGVGGMEEDLKLSTITGNMKGSLASIINRAAPERGMNLGVSETSIQFAMSSGKLSASEKATLQTVLDAHKAAGGKGDILTNAVAGIQGKFGGREDEVQFSGLANLGDAERFLNVKYAEGQMKTAREGLDSLMGAEGGAVLAGNSKAREIATAMLGGKDAQAIEDAVMQGNTKTAVEMLKKKGIHVTERELEAMKPTLRTVVDKKASGGTDSLQKILGVYANNQEAGDKRAIFDAMKAQSLGIADAASGSVHGDRLRKIAGLMGGMQESSDRMGDYNSMTGEIDSLAQDIMKEKDPGKREKMIAATGVLAGGIRARLKGRTGSQTASEIARSFGLNIKDAGVKEMLSRHGISGEGSTVVSSEMLAALRKDVGGMVTAKDITPAGSASVAGDKDDAIIKTLRSIAGNSKTQTDAIITLVEMQNGGKGKDEAARLRKTQAENNANADGSAATG